MRIWLTLFLVLAAPAWASLPGVIGDREFFLAQVRQEAEAYGVPPELADAVAMVETGYRPGAIGSSGEVGIMQILPSTAMQLGFHGTMNELLEPSVNIHLAVQYLSRAWAASGGDICRALMKYRAGLGEEVMSPLSAQYCNRAISWLMGLGSQLGVGASAPPAAVAADPYVIALRPIPVSTMPVSTMPEAQPIPQPRDIMAVSPPSAHRRTMAERAAALQARFDAHMRRYGNPVSDGDDPAE
jgi:soluble lytic murein transglycosylase-like protein